MRVKLQGLLYTFFFFNLKPTIPVSRVPAYTSHFFLLYTPAPGASTYVKIN